MQNYTLKVIAVKKETTDSVTITFKQPSLKKIQYSAGQYLTLILRINGRRYIRPYSFSSAPKVDNHLEITVKRVKGGIVSNYINDFIKVDEMIEVMSPMGDFTLPEQEDYPSIFLWGAGSGITPLFSIAKYSLFNNPSIKVNLLYGNKNRESTIFYDEIELLSSNYFGQFNAWNFFTQAPVDDNNPNIIQGRVDADKITTSLKINTLNESLHFICGPTGLKEAVKELLINKKTPTKNIYTEDFELIKSPEDFEDIETRKIKIFFNNQNHNLEITKGKSILEAALDIDIELPYSCQTGTCNTCLAKLKNGAVRMIGLKEKRDDLLNDEYLLCCSYPITNDVYIEI